MPKRLLDREATHKVLPALLRQKFSLFLRFAFREIAGSRDFVSGWHIEAMEHQLNRLDAGDNLQLIVTLPPRHLKSIIFSVAWVAWKLGRDPQTRFSCASYSYDLAEKHARDCLKVMEAPWYRMAFPTLRITKRALFDIETHAGGGRLATSVGGTFTGRGGDWIIIDDPMKADEALSEVAREGSAAHHAPARARRPRRAPKPAACSRSPGRASPFRVSTTRQVAVERIPSRCAFSAISKPFSLGRCYIEQMDLHVVRQMRPAWFVPCGGMPVVQPEGVDVKPVNVGWHEVLLTLPSCQGG